MKVTYEARFQKVHTVVCALRSFSRSGNIYKPKLALIALWSMQARHRPSKAAVDHPEVLVRSFRSHLQI